MGKEHHRQRRNFRGLESLFGPESSQLYERECGLFGPDGQHYAANERRQWIGDEARRLTSIHPHEDQDEDHAGRQVANFSYTITGISIPSIVDVFEIITKDPTKRVHFLDKVTTMETAAAAAAATGRPLTLICGPLYSVVDTHLRMSGSTARFEPFGSVRRHFYGPQSDLYLTPVASTIAHMFGRIYNYKWLMPHSLGVIAGQVVPNWRPFKYLQTFENLVWALIMLGLVVVSIMAVVRLRRKRCGGGGGGRSAASLFRLTMNPLFASLELMGSFLRQELPAKVTRRFNPRCLLAWLLVVTVLAACFDGSMRDLMASSLDPIRAESWEDLLRPTFADWPVIVSHVDPAVISLRHHDGGHVYQELLRQDRIIEFHVSEILSALSRLVLSALIYSGGVFLITDGEIARKQFWMSLTVAVQKEIPLRMEDADGVGSLYFSPPKITDFFYLPLGPDEDLAESYEGLLHGMRSSGLVELWFSEGSEYLRRFLPATSPSAGGSEYMEITLRDFHGGLIIYGASLLVALLILALEVLVGHRERLAMACDRLASAKRVLGNRLRARSQRISVFLKATNDRRRRRRRGEPTAEVRPLAIVRVTPASPSPSRIGQSAPDILSEAAAAAAAVVVSSGPRQDPNYLTVAKCVTRLSSDVRPSGPPSGLAAAAAGHRPGPGPRPRPPTTLPGQVE